MIFQHTFEKVLDGSKTQTRRLVKSGDYAANKIGIYIPDVNAHNKEFGFLWDLNNPYRTSNYGTCIVSEGGRCKWQIGCDYAVQPARGKAAVARIRVTNIRQEDVRLISVEDAKAEGFKDPLQFLETWVSMHDGAVGFFKPSDHKEELAGIDLDTPDDCYRQWLGRKLNWQDQTAEQVMTNIYGRQTDKYMAWALAFELVTS